MAPSFLASSLAAATWPVGALVAHAADAASPPPAPGAKDATAVRGRPHATLAEHVGMQFGCVPRLALAAYLYAYVMGDWRAFAAGPLAWHWVLPIVARNIALAWFVGGVTDFLLLSDLSPFRGAMRRHKYSGPDRYPRLLATNGTAPVARDIAWSTCSAAIAALLEAAALHAYATRRVESRAEGDLWWRHWPTVLLMLTWPYTQNIQFYTLHRLLHKWGTTTVPDVGAFLYKHVHSLHHAAKNPTAFSGIAMHPLESTLYFSYALFPMVFGAHPIAVTYIFLNLIAAAMLGHSGFEFPAQGSQPHYLHHNLVGVNYAENHLPIDLLMGTFAADEDEAQKSMARRGVGVAKVKAAE